MAMVVMTLAVHMLMGVFAGLMAVLVAVMSMNGGLMLMLVLMFVFVVAAHSFSPPFQLLFL
jgi:hypothetical protein